MKVYCVVKEVRSNQNLSLACGWWIIIFWKYIGEMYAMRQYSYSRVWLRETFNGLQNIFMQVLPDFVYIDLGEGCCGRILLNILKISTRVQQTLVTKILKIFL